MPPQSLALFETYNAPAYPVNFTANLTVPGFPPIPHWYIEVNGWRTSSTEPSITFLLRPGRDSTAGFPLPMPPKGSDPRARLIPVLPSSLVVGNSWLWVNVTYIPQWAINISWNASRGSVFASGLPHGATAPANGAMTWWNNSQPLGLRFEPDPGYAFDRWNGEGGGSFSGYSPTATLTPTAPLEEQAIFVPGTLVTFEETGLAAGTPWDVTVRGYTVSSTDTTATFFEIPGSWSDEVGNVSGYQLITPGQGAWWQNTLVVGNESMIQPVAYTPLTPARSPTR